MNLANKITMVRVVLIPVFLVVLYLDFNYNNLVALAIFIIASISDFLDGQIARRCNQTSDFGKFLDPLADKLLVISAMAIFCEWGNFPAWAFMIVLARGFAVTGLRLIAVGNGTVIAAGWSGKVKTFSTMVALCIMLVLPEPWFPFPQFMSTLAIVVILGTTVYSGVEYFIKNKDVISLN